MVGAPVLPANRSDLTKPATIKISSEAIEILRKISGLTGDYMEKIVTDLVLTHGTSMYRDLIKEENKKFEAKGRKANDRNHDA